MRYKMLFTVIALLMLSSGIYLNYVNNNKAVATIQYDNPLIIEKQTLGVATRAGCLRTMYTDDELIKNKIFIEGAIGVRTADLCYLNG